MDFGTGSVAVTLDGLPDPDSRIVYSYVTQTDEEITIRTATVPVDDFAFRHTTENPGVKPGSVTITYLSNAQTNTLTDQGNGLLSGDGSGSIYYASGELGFTLNELPDPGTQIEIAYEEGEVAGGVVDITLDGGGLMSGTIAGAPLLPGSVQIEFVVERDSNVHNDARGGDDWRTYQSTYNHTKRYNDNTAGGWSGIVGTIDYQTGDFTLQAIENYNYSEYVANTGY